MTKSTLNINEHPVPDHRRKFQLDRIIFFSDAIFAIAITILILEIKIPELPRETVTNAQFNESLNELIPKFAGFIISFFIIGLYWTKHHTLFGYVTDYNNKLIWLNLLFLLSIVTMPFTTGFYSEYIMHLQKTPFMLYVGNIIACGGLLAVMLLYVKNPKRNLSSGLDHNIAYEYFLARSIVIPVMFILLAVMYLISPHLSLYAPALIPLTIVPVTKYYKRKSARSQV